MADQDHGISARLRAARMQQGLQIEHLARELKNPRAVLETIERGEWSRLGAPVFARHLVGRYARRLGVVVDLDEVAQKVESTVLHSQVPVSRIGRFRDFSTRHAAYLGGTLLVLPLVYAALSMTANGPAEYRPLDPVQTVSLPPPLGPTEAPAAVDGVAGAGLASAASPVPRSMAAVAPQPMPARPDGAVVDAEPPTPVAASLAGGVSPGRGVLELRFNDESWIEVSARDGGLLDRALARAGESRRFDAAAVGRVTIGNVDGTEVLLDGSRVNLEAVRAANVARFALSSEGSIEAVAR